MWSKYLSVPQFKPPNSTAVQWAVSIKAASLLCPRSAALALQMLLHQTESEKKNEIIQYGIKFPLSFKVCFELSVRLVAAQETWGSTKHFVRFLERLKLAR